MRIPIIYDGGAADWSRQDIQSVLEPVEAVRAVLADAGHEAPKVPVRRDLRWLDAVRDADLVFNLCEGIGGVSHHEYHVASSLELMGVPYTGCSARTMLLCHRKPLLNTLLAAHGLPIPEWIVADGRPLPEVFPLPAIVKPAAEDASVGITQGSIVSARDTLEERVAAIERQFGQVMVQRYVAGREIAVAFVGPHVLPLSEIDFSRMPEGAWPILSFDAKWAPGSAEDHGSRPICPAPVSPTLRRRLIRVATDAWRAVEGRGYGRVDLRVDRDGRPWILEVNPNPDNSTDAGLANMAAAAGWSYADLVLHIVDAAVEGAAALEGQPA